MMRSLGTLVDWLKRVKTIDVPIGHEAMVYATKWVQMENTRAEQELGFSFRPVQESMSDAISWLHQAGHISAKQAGKLA